MFPSFTTSGCCACLPASDTSGPGPKQAFVLPACLILVSSSRVLFAFHHPISQIPYVYESYCACCREPATPVRPQMACSECRELSCTGGIWCITRHSLTGIRSFPVLRPSSPSLIPRQSGSSTQSAGSGILQQVSGACSRVLQSSQGG